MRPEYLLAKQTRGRRTPFHYRNASRERPLKDEVCGV